MLPRRISEPARAKVNLTLHVTGLRADGYHLLDSLVVFAGIGDVLHATPAGETSLTVEGPFSAEVPQGADNLVLRAAEAFGGTAAFTLVKTLPVASGIGGGSADAAAAVRALARLVPGEAEIGPEIVKRLARLGADIPVCLRSLPARMRGVGDRIEPISIPESWILLVNPRVGLSTAHVFAALPHKENQSMPDTLPDWPDARRFGAWLRTQRNDLQAPAVTLAPVIAEVLERLADTDGALVARMSGSGATCFALYETEAGVRNAARDLGFVRPDWWIAPGPIGAAQVIRATT